MSCECHNIVIFCLQGKLEKRAKLVMELFNILKVTTFQLKGFLIYFVFLHNTILLCDVT